MNGGRVNACLKADDLSFWRGERAVVSGLSFTAAPGDRIAVLGANGSGKTTLIRTILGFSPYRGTLEVEGREVRDRPKEARKAAAAVFGDADPQLLMPTVYDELAFSLKAAEERAGGPDVRAFAGRFGLVPLLERHPSQLSSGEKRKVLLAQSLGRRPSILLLDEPTSDLDARGSRRLREMLAQVPQTIILATHHYDLAMALCRKAVVLGGGKAAVYEDIRRLFDDPAALDRWELL